jgi:hypothetical protein
VVVKVLISSTSARLHVRFRRTYPSISIDKEVVVAIVVLLVLMDTVVAIVVLLVLMDTVAGLVTPGVADEMVADCDISRVVILVVGFDVSAITDGDDTLDEIVAPLSLKVLERGTARLVDTVLAVIDVGISGDTADDTITASNPASPPILSPSNNVSQKV